MTDRPDRRFWYLFVPLALVFVASAFIDSHLTEVLLFAAAALFGFGVAVIEIQEGRCLSRPSISRDASPGAFGIEVLAAVSFGLVGAWKLWANMC